MDQAMSTKLNADELAAKAWPDAWIVADQSVIDHGDIRTGYASAIREVAQPLADERDEYRALVEQVMHVLPRTIRWGVSAGKERFMWTEEEAAHAFSDESKLVESIRAILAKYPKP
jgi:hypothetical protein